MVLSCSPGKARLGAGPLHPSARRLRAQAGPGAGGYRSRRGSGPDSAKAEVEAGLIQHCLITLLSRSAAPAQRIPPESVGLRVRHPTGHGRCGSVGLGRAALGFISTRKFYRRNYTAVNCTKTGSREGEEPPAPGQEDTLTPLFARCFSLLPNLGSLSPAPQRSPSTRTRLVHRRGLS